MDKQAVLGSRGTAARDEGVPYILYAELALVIFRDKFLLNKYLSL